MAATADLMQQKLRQRYVASPETNVGALLQRYRDDQNIETYGAYVDHIAPSALYATGLGDGNITTPDHASLAVTTQLDVRLLMGAEITWQNFFTQHFIRQWGVGGSNAWVFSIHTNGRMRLAISTDGTNLFGPECTVDTPFRGTGVPTWLRNTFTLSAGTGTWNYFTSPDGTTWDPLGAQNLTQGGMGASIFNSPLVMDLPCAAGFGMRIYYAEVRSTVGGTIITNPDFRGLAPGTTSFADSTGKTWTVSGTSVIATSPAALPDDANAFWNAFVP